jgi:hypothetical protein
MSIEPIPGTELCYELICYDSNGNERVEPDGLASDRVEKRVASGDVTDVFLFSHGWMGDIPAAKAQYNAWTAAMAGCESDIARMTEARGGRFAPIMIGLHWPSLPWGDERLAGPETASFAPQAGADVDPVDALVDDYASKIADTPAARAALRTIIEWSMDHTLERELPPEIVAAYATLNAESGLGSEGEGGDPSSDREPFDPQAVVREADDNSVSFAIPGIGLLLSPLRTMSFWKMKDRAREFGATAGADLLARLQRASLSTRFHLMGHSFGCIVVSSILAGRDGHGVPVRPVESITLAQGALSLWSFCESIPSVPARSGYFHSAVNGRVKGPILTTQSELDYAVGRYYPLAAGVAGQVIFNAPGSLPKYGAVGTYGIQGIDDRTIDLTVAGIDHDYGFRPGMIYNIESTSVIKTLSGSGGAHCDIAHPEIAHSVWEAARVV